MYLVIFVANACLHKFCLNYFYNYNALSKVNTTAMKTIEANLISICEHGRDIRFALAKCLYNHFIRLAAPLSVKRCTLNSTQIIHYRSSIISGAFLNGDVWVELD